MSISFPRDHGPPRDQSPRIEATPAYRQSCPLRRWRADRASWLAQGALSLNLLLLAFALWLLAKLSGWF